MKLEQYLHYGELNIGCRVELTFCATFSFYSGNNIIIESDRGIEHLLLLLEAKLSDDKEKEVAVNGKYQYSLNYGGIKNIERIIQKNYLNISSLDKKIIIFGLQTEIPRKNCHVGLYFRKSEGSTIQEAFQNFEKATPELMSKTSFDIPRSNLVKLKCSH